MRYVFEVERLRSSVTQGEARVLCNGQTVVQFGDAISMEGRYDAFGGWGSTIPDLDFIAAALRNYRDAVEKCLATHQKEI